MPHPERLSQDFELGFTYTRSTGPTVGRFLTGLRERHIEGVRTSDGRVVVPPMEYDPVSAAALDEFVEIEATGELVSWCWVSEPRASHPLQEPFAWGMILLDGADVPMVHCVAASSEAQVHTGMRVQARWAEQTRGHILDIACFEALAGDPS